MFQIVGKIQLKTDKVIEVGHYWKGRDHKCISVPGRLVLIK
jgi:hypothetical protein